jgi:hypothetical protein
MYGFRDASNGWMRDWQSLLLNDGFEVGKANGALFLHPTRKLRGAVHGDDFFVLGNRKQLDEMGKLLASKYSVRESHRLGFSDHCVKEATILNRVVKLHRGDDGKKEVHVMADQRHVEIVHSSLGFNSRTKAVNSPMQRTSDSEFVRRSRDPELSPEHKTLYRSNVMRMSFIAQDRADLGEAVKTLAQNMQNPKTCHLGDLKRAARYLLYRPSVALVYRQQRLPTRLTLSVDSDHAADKTTRKSTTGMVMQLGNHTVKNTSNLQSAIGLNVSEAEYYALCHGAAHGLGMQAFLKDLGLSMQVLVQSDSSSAKAFASRRGLGKQRHVQTRFLWLQERIAAGHLKILKIRGEDNISDILTKCVNGALLARHCKTIGLRPVATKSHLQKSTLT